MLHITRAIIVEGKYDRQRVEEVCDAYCFVTGGFNIFKNREKREFIRLLAREKGLIVLTDSDRAGALIRSYLKSVVGEGEVLQAYIPEIKGKEKRKNSPSAAGTLGVEGMERELLAEVLRPFAEDGGERGEEVTKADFFDLGLSGGPGSREKRAAICRGLKIPASLSANALLDAVNAIMTKKEFLEAVNSNKF